MRKKEPRTLTGWSTQDYRALLCDALVALVMNFVIELLARRNFSDTISFLTESPLTFLYGALIIFFTLSLSMLFRKRTFFFCLAVVFWMALAITDYILLRFRSMPLTAADIFLMSATRDIFEKYMSHVGLLLVMLGISAALGAVCYLLLTTKSRRRSFSFALTYVTMIGLALISCTLLMQGNGTLDRASGFSSLPKAYHRNGFCYSFSVSLLTGGVNQPKEYSEENVKEIIDEQTDLPETAQNRPNIIFLQMESFFDANYLKDVTFSKNPVPVFESLKRSGPSGLLSVPAIGAGTANTEFEVLTGMNLDHFGVGEYPYMTTVNKVTTESVATVLQELGYATHAIHNNNATFYDRNIVYSNLSFETFTTLEYMNDVDYNPLGWAKDSVLTNEILKALQSTADRDFVFGVSVQAHGKYPTEPIEGAPTIRVSGMDDNEGRKNGMEYYLYQLKESDKFLGELTRTLANFDEPTILVVYGDHLPSFNIQQEELSYGDVQSTEYAIWANYPVHAEDRDLQTYQLGAYILDLCNIHEGVIMRHHQSYGFPEENEVYESKLEALEYDMLSGDRYSLAGRPLEPTQLQFGVEEIVLTAVVEDTLGSGGYYLRGDHFTPCSRVYLNGAPVETEFRSEGLLFVRELKPKVGDEIFVAQISISDETQILSQTKTFEWTQ